MDLESRMNVLNDKKYFLSRIKTHPLFLLRHLRSLSNIIFEKYKSRFFIKLRGVHRGNKRQPRWLKNIPLTIRDKNNNFFKFLQNIPSRSIIKFVIRDTDQKTVIKAIDSEDFLAKHRWSELIDNLFEHTKRSLPWELPVTIVQQILNPPKKHDLAWETYSTCERVCNLLTWISFVPLHQRQIILPESLFIYLEESMQWVLSHLEYYGEKTNNHIINNARCLIMAGTVLSNAKAVTSGIRILDHMLDKLIQPEGSLRERSSHYQLLVLTWLLDAYTFLKSSAYSNSHSIMNVLEKNIKNMLITAAITSDNFGYLQLYIGDISPDLSPEKTAERLMLCYPTEWPVTKLEINSRDDWWILKNKTNKIVINCPSGIYPHSFPTHAHNDIPSFVWLHNQSAILIDSGRARYTKDPISLSQKSGISHNIPLVNGFPPLCESLIVNGNWQPEPYAVARIKVSEKSNRVIKISHDGFKRATPVSCHERIISLHENTLQVSDYFTGSASTVEIEFYWHFHANFVEFDQDQSCIRSTHSLVFFNLNAMQILPQIKYYGIEAQHSWQSSKYGFGTPSPVMVVCFNVTLPFTVHTHFRIEPCVELQGF